ncbi:MAG: glycoside hydrolase family 3 C-terminal domain-containing protein [Inhella sp.]
MGKPWAAVLINGKPLVLPPALQAVPALIECFNPGMLGGQAVAEALFGLLNPSGRCPSASRFTWVSSRSSTTRCAVSMAIAMRT